MKKPNVFGCARQYMLALAAVSQNSLAARYGCKRCAVSQVVISSGRSKGIEALVAETLGLTHAECFPDHHDPYLTKFPNLEALAEKVMAHASSQRTKTVEP